MTGDESSSYGTGVLVTAALVFLPAWGYAIAQLGWFFGIAVGWIPAALFAGVVGVLWPLVVFLVGLAVFGIVLMLAFA